MEEIIKKLQNKEIKNHLQEYGICNISLFGSYSNGNQNDDSDIDLLYQLDDSISYKPRGIFAVKGFLEEKLGKTCDMVNVDYMDKSIENDILKSKKIIW